jgi:hypothetical protein
MDERGQFEAYVQDTFERHYQEHLDRALEDWIGEMLGQHAPSPYRFETGQRLLNEQLRRNRGNGSLLASQFTGVQHADGVLDVPFDFRRWTCHRGEWRQR